MVRDDFLGAVRSTYQQEDGEECVKVLSLNFQEHFLKAAHDTSIYISVEGD